MPEAAGIPLSFREWRNTGNWRWPGSKRGVHTKGRGLCGGDLRNVQASML